MFSTLCRTKVLWPGVMGACLLSMNVSRAEMKSKLESGTPQSTLSAHDAHLAGGSVCVTGRTQSDDFPTGNAFQNERGRR